MNIMFKHLFAAVTMGLVCTTPTWSVETLNLPIADDAIEFPEVKKVILIKYNVLNMTKLNDLI